MKSVMMNERPSMLYVDDDPLTHRMIKLYLNAKNVNIDFAFDGKMAFHHIQHKKYDLIISDIQMPEMDGLSLLEKIRETNRSIKVILVSSYEVEEHAKSAMRKGAFGIFRKPFSTAELLDIMDHTLKR
jgi:CheY-like chemotaxis protein